MALGVDGAGRGPLLQMGEVDVIRVVAEGPEVHHGQKRLEGLLNPGGHLRGIRLPGPSPCQRLLRGGAEGALAALL